MVEGAQLCASQTILKWGYWVSWSDGLCKPIPFWCSSGWEVILLALPKSLHVFVRSRSTIRKMAILRWRHYKLSTSNFLTFYDKLIEKRLKNLNLPSLEYRRLRGDLIECFKIIHHKYDPHTTDKLLTLTFNSITRTNSLKITKPRFNSDKLKTILY